MPVVFGILFVLWFVGGTIKLIGLLVRGLMYATRNDFQSFRSSKSTPDQEPPPGNDNGPARTQVLAADDFVLDKSPVLTLVSKKNEE